jgi:transglutaminase-like putative cysteine protease
MTLFTRCSATLLLFSLVQPASAQVQYKIEFVEKQTVTATLVATSSFPNLEAKEWIAFAASAPELPGQKNTKTTFDFPTAETVTEWSPLARPVILARVPAKSDELKTKLSMKVQYMATLYSRHLAVAGDGVASKVAPLTASESTAALAEFGDVDFKTPAFQKWLTSAGYIRRKTEGEIPFARRVFLGLRGSNTYDYKTDMDRKASVVCDAGKSDCGGLSLLFTAVMRANEIPTRTLFGRWATSAKADDKIGAIAYYQWHVRAEFYAATVGWVPVDLATSIQHDKSKDGLEQFGHDAGDFLTLHIDANLQLDTVTFGKNTTHNLQGPIFWVSGSGKMDKRIDTESWSVEVKK